MIDLHTHSIFSDGSDTPEALALRADQLGLTALALTDHDTLDGLRPFLAMQVLVQTRLVPGIELSCRFMGQELHIIGLFINHEDAKFQERVQNMHQRRNLRNLEMVARMNALGIKLSIDDVTRLAPSKLVSRMHFAQALVNIGAASSKHAAFHELIGNGRPAHVPFEDLGPDAAASWIHEAGGVPIVAHPGRSTRRNFRWDEAMADLKAMGIMGFEAYYSDYGPQETLYFLDLATRLDMLPSGGSDYHGNYKPGIALGQGRGQLAIPDEVLTRIESRCKHHASEDRVQ